MLKVGAALCKSVYYIFFKWKALPSQSNENKLFEAILSKFLTDHTIKELVDYLSLAVQPYDFKTFKRLASIYWVDFVFKLIKDPRHRSRVSLSIVEFETLAFKYLNLR